jgi:hypothetical protein
LAKPPLFPADADMLTLRESLPLGFRSRVADATKKRRSDLLARPPIEPMHAQRNPIAVTGLALPPKAALRLTAVRRYPANKKATIETFRAAPTKGASRERLQSSLLA